VPQTTESLEVRIRGERRTAARSRIAGTYANWKLGVADGRVRIIQGAA
jgi:hypothetical protein